MIIQKKDFTFEKILFYRTNCCLVAGVVELVDTLDLGSSDESRGGSSPSTRTTK